MRAARDVRSISTTRSMRARSIVTTGRSPAGGSMPPTTLEPPPYGLAIARRPQRQLLDPRRRHGLGDRRQTEASGEQLGDLALLLRVRAVALVAPAPELATWLLIRAHAVSCHRGRRLGKASSAPLAPVRR